MQVVLVMFRSDGERRSFSVVRNMTVIGRREDCDLRIPVGDVSRKHCRILSGDEGVRIEDLGSSNGTFVNHERVQQSELSAGDTLGVGPVQFVVQINGVPDDADLVAPTAAVAVASAEDSSVGYQVPTIVDELPAEDEILEHQPLQEAHLEEAPLEESEPEELLSDELDEDELHIEELTEQEPEELSAEEDEISAEPISEEALMETPLKSPVQNSPAMEDAEPLEELSDEELEEELESLDEEPAVAKSTAAVADADSLDELTEAEPTEALSSEDDLLFEDELEEAPLTKSAAPMDELDLAEAPAAESSESLEEFEDMPVAEEDLEVEPLAAETTDTEPLEDLEVEAKAPEPKPVVEDDLDELPLPPPAHASEKIEELELDDEDTIDEPVDVKAAAAEGEPKTAEGSAWDFVIEETETEHTPHTMHIDLDAPHPKS